MLKVEPHVVRKSDTAKELVLFNRVENTVTHVSKKVRRVPEPLLEVRNATNWAS